jgi:hypothetical protein
LRSDENEAKAVVCGREEELVNELETTERFSRKKLQTFFSSIRVFYLFG